MSVAPPVDPTEFDFDHIVADIDEIRRHLPQRDAMEQLTAVKRAGADMVLTYFARDIAEVLS